MIVRSTDLLKKGLLNFFKGVCYMENKLSVNSIITGGIEIGLKNSLAIIVNYILWILTIWIPYINVGTTIGLNVGIIAKASKGEVISIVEIFNPEYRKYMGEYFLTRGLLSVGIVLGMVFLVGPGIVISLAWSQALFLAIDKGKNPMEAISLSNKLTYGKKGTIFLAYLVASVLIGVLSVIFTLIPVIGALLVIILVLLAVFVNFGITAYIYKSLCSDL